MYKYDWLLVGSSKVMTYKEHLKFLEESGIFDLIFNAPQADQKDTKKDDRS